MKAKFRTKVIGMEKNVPAFVNSTAFDGMVRLKLASSKGKVDTTLNTNAQLAVLDANIFLREIIANQMKIGANITITVSDEEIGDDKE